MTDFGGVLFDISFACEGRRYVENGRLFLNASGASIKGLFRGKDLTLNLFSEPVEKGRNAYIRLTLDGRTRRIRLPKGEKTIRLQCDKGRHEFEIVKLTESQNNSFAVTSVETDGEFLPFLCEPSLRIEFIGDSITTGFGVLSRETYGEYQTKEQDVTKAFPHLVSRALNAEYQIVAAGGWGIYKSKYSDYAIPDYYDNVDLWRNEGKYDRSAFPADLCVVTLGTNDYSYLADLPEEERAKEREEVKARFSAFIRKLLRNGKPIILVYGFFDYPDLGVMTEEVRREIESPLLSTLEVQSAASLGDIRAGHPGKRTHLSASKRLIKLIRKVLFN